MTRPSPGRAIGLDLGTRRIGVAVTNEDRTVATPLEVVDRSNAARADARLRTLVDEWTPTIIIVGLPIHLSGASGAAVEFVESEMARLRDTITVPMVTYDERLSTVSADRSLGDMQLDSRARRRVVDMVAASVILQGWIDQHQP